MEIDDYSLIPFRLDVVILKIYLLIFNVVDGEDGR